MSHILDGESLEWRDSVTVDPGNIDSNLTDKDTYIDLSGLPSAEFWNNVKSDGGDLRASLVDGTTRIPLEVISINSGAETGWVRVKIGTTSSSVDTVIYLFWGNAGLSQPAEDATHGRENVNDSWYKLVGHCQESGDGSANEYLDATSNDNDGQGGEGTGTKVPTQASFIIDNGQDHDGTDDHIAWGTGSSLEIGPATPISISCLVNLDTNTNHGVFAIKATANGTSLSYEFRHDTSAQVLLNLGGETHTTTATLSTATDYYVAFSYTGVPNVADNKKIYIDGAVELFKQLFAVTLHSGEMLTSGAMRNTTNYNPLNGKLQELKASIGIARSAAWFKADRINMKTPLTYYTLGTPEQAGNGNAIALGANF